MPPIPELTARAQQMRKNPTHAEAKLWSRLRRKKVGGWKFRRQHILAPFIVDFYCHPAQLVIEIDGPVHNSIDRQKYDQTRTEKLRARYEVEILRFPASMVLRSLGDVLTEIREFLDHVE